MIENMGGSFTFSATSITECKLIYVTVYRAALVNLSKG